MSSTTLQTKARLGDPEKPVDHEDVRDVCCIEQIQKEEVD